MPKILKKVLMFLSLAGWMLSTLISCSSQKLSSDQRKEQAELYYSMGTNALIAQNYTVALNNLLKAAELTPERSDIHNNLGMAYHFKNKRELAYKHVQKAIELDENNSDALSNMASLYIAEKKYAQAKELYQKVLQQLTYDKQYLTYYNLGKIEYDQKNFPVAREFFQQSVKENPGACASHFYLGMIEYRTSQWSAAADAFREAYYGTCYTNEYPLYYHAKALEQKGLLQQAAMKYQELIDRFNQSTLKPKAQQALQLISSKAPSIKSTTASRQAANLTPDGTAPKGVEQALFNRNSEPEVESGNPSEDVTPQF
jgi:type IV pilus assembly protein PilF